MSNFKTQFFLQDSHNNINLPSLKKCEEQNSHLVKPDIHREAPQEPEGRKAPSSPLSKLLTW